MKESLDLRASTLSNARAISCSKTNEVRWVAERLWVHLAVAALTILACIPFATFETNDDVSMMMIASGDLGELNDSHRLVFVSSILGRLLSLGYRITGRVEWYGLMMLAFGGMAAAMIGASAQIMLRDVLNTTARAIPILSTASLAVLAVTNIQFTRIGILLGTASGITFAAALSLSSSSRNIGRYATVSAWLIATISILVRYNAGLLGLALTIPLIGAIFFQSEEKKQTFRVILLFTSAFGIASFGSKKLEDSVYAGAKWQRALTINRLALPFSDYHLQRKVCVPEVCAQGSQTWTVNDLDLLDIHAYSDELVFSQESFETATHALFPQGTGALARLKLRLGAVLGSPKAPSIPSDAQKVGPSSQPNSALGIPSRDVTPQAGSVSDDQRPSAIVGRQISALFSPGLFAFIALTAAAFLISDRRSRIEITIGTTLSCLSVVCLFLFTKSLPERVLDPLWTSSGVVNLMIGISRASMWCVRSSSLLRTGTGITYMILVTMSLWSTKVRHEFVMRMRRDFATATAGWNGPIIAIAGGFPIEAIWRPLWGNDSYRTHDWLVVGWTSQTPIEKSSLDRLGMRRPLLEAPCSPSHLVLASTRVAEQINRFAIEHGRPDCELRVRTTAGRITVWQGSS